MRLTRLAVVGVLAVAGLACGGSPYGPTARGNSVNVVNNQFRPSSLILTGGAVVTFTWNSGGVAHNVTFEDGPSSGPAQPSPASFNRTFGTAGTYRYRCSQHSSNFNSGMIGTILVP